MESSKKTISLENLDSGEEVCPKCHKGKMKPFNPKFEVNHCFICDNCGAQLTISPNIIVE